MNIFRKRSFFSSIACKVQKSDTLAGEPKQLNGAEDKKQNDAPVPSAVCRQAGPQVSRLASRDKRDQHGRKGPKSLSSKEASINHVTHEVSGGGANITMA